MKEFLQENEFVDYSSGLIGSVAEQLFSDSMNSIDKAITAYEFVRDKIAHSFDCNANVITAKASDVLKYKTGICHAKANLLAALLRLQGIPAGFCYQHLTLMDDDSKGYCLHCYNAIYLRDKWIEVDARGNKEGISAQFSLHVPILAFKIRPHYDEYFIDGIYSTPDMQTMDMLTRAKTLQEVKDGLSEIPSAKPSLLF